MLYFGCYGGMHRYGIIIHIAPLVLWFFGIYVIAFQIILFPVRRMMTVISGNEMAGLSLLCLEESQNYSMLQETKT